MYDVLICITTWNTLDLVRNCLDSIFSHPPQSSFKVTLLDDASTDGIEQIIPRLFPDVAFHRSLVNLGFIRANNRLLQLYQTEARYFLLLNADTVVDPGTIDRMVQFMGEHPEAGIAGCQVVKPDGTLDWPCRRGWLTPEAMFYRALGLDSRFPHHRRFGAFYLTYLPVDMTCEVASVVGAFLLIRRETLEKIGLMDEAFFMYGDDLDWCYRARQAGWQVFYVHDAKITHYKSQSNVKRSYRMIYWWYHSTWIVFRKHVAERYNFIVNVLVWVGLHGSCLLSWLRNALRPRKRLPSRV